MKISHGVLALLIAATSACTTVRQHKIFHAVGMAVGEAAILCDYRMTMQASNGGRWDRNGFREMNPVLGSTPSATTLQVASASAALLTALVYFLPDTKGWTVVKSTYYFMMPTLETANVLHLQGRLCDGPSNM